MAKTKAPKPVKIEGRTCFGVAWFRTEAEALEQDAINRKKGRTVNGGWFDGMHCGRASEFDTVDKTTGAKLYACRM